MERLLSRLEVDYEFNACWVYPCTNESGYGVIGTGGRGGSTRRTHRLTYEWFVGPIPEGTEIDHLCRNRACCNPNHLQAVSRATNIQRGVRKTLQTHCKQGHEFTPQNTRQTERQRVCLTCQRDRNQRQYAKRKGMGT